MNKRNKRVLLVASTVLLGLVATTNVKADSTAEQLSNNVQATAITSNNNVSSTQQQSTENNSQSAVVAAQTVNIPDGYTLDAVRNVKTQAQADELEKIAINGMSNNNYRSNSDAANERVDINNLK